MLWGPWGWPGTQEHVCPPLSPLWHSHTKLKGLPEARPHSPNGFAFVRADSWIHVCTPGLLPGGSGGRFVSVTIATGPGLGSPLTPPPVLEEGGGANLGGWPGPHCSGRGGGEGTHPSDSQGGRSSLPRPLGASSPFTGGLPHEGFISSPLQGPWGGRGPHFVVEGTEALAGMGAYELGP